MFKKIFAKIHQQNKEINLIGIWGKDGLELEKILFTEAVDINIDLLGAEVADMVAKLADLKNFSDHYFFKLKVTDRQVFIFSLTADYFLIVLSDKEIIPGRLNFYFELYKEKLIFSL